MNNHASNRRKNIEEGLTIGLVLAFLLNIKKVWVPNVLIEGGLFNEYLDLSIYLFDGAFLLWLGYIILRHEKYTLSIYRKMFHVEHKLKTPLFLIVAFILWQWVSVIQADQIPLAIRHALTMSEMGIFVLVQLIRLFHVEQLDQNEEKAMFHVEHLTVDKSVPRGTSGYLYSSLLKGMIYFALFNAFIVFIQISTQHSIGLKYLGESLLQVGSPGVATISLFGEKILRGYGLFPHPNILAAFLGLTLLALLTENVPRGTLLSRKLKSRLEKMFHVEQSVSNDLKPMFHVEHWVTSIIMMALILTFSRTGILLTLIGALIIVPRGTLLRQTKEKLGRLFHVEQSRDTEPEAMFHVEQLVQRREKKMFHVEHLGIILGIILLAMVSLTLSKSFSERELSLVEYSELSSFELLGNGAGSYGTHLYSQIQSINEWSIQPIHNYFLLAYYELGIIGLFLIVFLLIQIIAVQKSSKLFHVEQPGDIHSKSMFHVEHLERDNTRGYLAILSFLTIFALGDHFFYTIPQGQAVFWLGILMAVIVPRGTMSNE